MYQILLLACVFAQLQVWVLCCWESLLIASFHQLVFRWRGLIKFCREQQLPAFPSQCLRAAVLLPGCSTHTTNTQGCKINTSKPRTQPLHLNITRLHDIYMLLQTLLLVTFICTSLLFSFMSCKCMQVLCKNISIQRIPHEDSHYHGSHLFSFSLNFYNFMIPEQNETGSEL